MVVCMTKQTITLFQVSMILIGSIFYSFTFYNMLTCIFIVVGPYLLGILMSIFLDIKAAKKVNPIHLFLVSTLIMIFGFYSPIFIVLSVTFGSYAINSISSQNNMKVYMVNATHRELSLLIYTTWRNMGNIFLQFFILIVIVGVGVFYDVEWSQLFQTIVGKGQMQIEGLSIQRLMFMLAICCWLGMVGLGMWIGKKANPNIA